MSDSKASTAALIERLAEDDETLLERQPELLDGKMVERLYTSSWPTRYVPFLLLFAAFVIFQQQSTWWDILGLTALYTFGTWRLDRLRAAYDEDPMRLQRAKYWGDRFAYASVFTGLTWGLLAWIYYTPGAYAHHAILSVAWAGLATAAITARSPWLPAFYYFIVPITIPFYARALLAAESTTIAMMLFGIVMLIVVCIWAHAANKREKLAIALRLRNAELVTEIDKARNDATLAMKAAERALNDRAAGFAAAERLADTGAWEWHRGEDIGNGRIVCSDNAYRLLGLSPAAAPAALGSLLENVPAEDKPALEQFLTRLTQEGGQHCVTFRVRLGDGSERRLRCDGEAKRDSEGRVGTVLGAIRALP